MKLIYNFDLSYLLRRFFLDARRRRIFFIRMGYMYNFKLHTIHSPLARAAKARSGKGEKHEQKLKDKQKNDKARVTN